MLRILQSLFDEDMQAFPKQRDPADSPSLLSIVISRVSTSFPSHHVNEVAGYICTWKESVELLFSVTCIVYKYFN